MKPNYFVHSSGHSKISSIQLLFFWGFEDALQMRMKPFWPENGGWRTTDEGKCANVIDPSRKVAKVIRQPRQPDSWLVGAAARRAGPCDVPSSSANQGRHSGRTARVYKEATWLERCYYRCHDHASLTEHLPCLLWKLLGAGKAVLSPVPFQLFPPLAYYQLVPCRDWRKAGHFSPPHAEIIRDYECFSLFLIHYLRPASTSLNSGQRLYLL